MLYLEAVWEHGNGHKVIAAIEKAADDGVADMEVMAAGDNRIIVAVHKGKFDKDALRELIWGFNGGAWCEVTTPTEDELDARELI